MRRAPASKANPSSLSAYWSYEPAELFRELGAGPGGLSSAEAAERLRAHGPNELREQDPLSRLRVLMAQLRSPLLLLLVFAAAVSALTGQWVDALIVLSILVASVAIGYWREYGARAAAAALRAHIHTRARVLRDGRPQPVALRDVVPGDVVLLSAGSLVPGDGLLLEATDFFVSEAVLTGESFPVEKKAGAVPSSAALARRANSVLMGTNVRSGTARCLVVATGLATEFGTIAHRLTLRPPETEFDRGIRRFGYLLTSAMLVMVLVVFVAHMLRERPPVETLLFSIALAVGLSPELLPAILSVNLSRGARMMARHGVLVRRLSAIENLGSMDVLCTDKTGTLTEGVVQLEGAYDAAGAPSAEVLELAAGNAALETGLANPLDEAILEARRPDLSRLRKLAEVPFDFVRKRISIVVQGPDGARLVTKGAFHPVLATCTRTAGGSLLDVAEKAHLEGLHRDWGLRGIRVLAVATRGLPDKAAYGRDDEQDLAGFLTFVDRPKEGPRGRSPTLVGSAWRSSSSPATAGSSRSTWRSASACRPAACSPEASSTSCTTRPSGGAPSGPTSSSRSTRTRRSGSSFP